MTKPTGRAKQRSYFPDKKRLFSHDYLAPVVRKDAVVKVKVCHKAFIIIFGISN